MSILLKNENLEVSVLSPSTPRFSQRFDASCAVEQVTLNGRHTFCVPEQFDPVRRTCNGVGLSGEFVWDGVAAEAPRGRQFPKPGVGLLTQIEDNKPYDMWSRYEVEPFEIAVEQRDPGRVAFTQQPRACMGYAFRIIREAVLFHNTLTIHTVIENTGDAAIGMEEYHHNFVAIDNMPMGPGYRLEIPFATGLSAVADSAFHGEKDLVRAENGAIVWDRPSTDTGFFMIAEEKSLAHAGRYTWRMSHSASSAGVSETVSFAPHMLRLWSVEHTACAEMFVRIHLEPGQKQGWSRTWTFWEDSGRQ